MKRKVLHVIVLTLVLSGMLWGNHSKTEAAEKVYNWRMVYNFAPSDLEYTQSLPKFVEWVEQASKGRLKITLYAGGQLCPPSEALDNLRVNSFQLLIDVSAYHGGKIRGGLPIFSLPMGPRGTEDYLKLYTKYGAHELVNEAYAPFGVQLLNHICVGGLNLLSKKPIHKMEDFKGLKIRSTGLMGKLWTVAGASAVFIPGSEIYIAMKTGVVDGCTWNNAAIQTLNLNEVVKYIICGYPFPPGTSTTAPNMVSLVNKEAFDELPQDLQKIVVRYTEKSSREMESVFADWDDWFYFRGGKEKLGMEVIQLSKEQTDELREMAMEKIWPEAAAESELAAKYIGLVTQMLRDEGVIK